MKIRCLYTNFFDLKNVDSINRIKKYIRLSDGQLNLVKDKVYFVYGIEFRDNSPWFYICLDDEDNCPTAYPRELFEIIENTLSKHWQLLSQLTDNKSQTSLVIEPWAKDPYFYERLIDCDSAAQEVFSEYRYKIETE